MRRTLAALVIVTAAALLAPAPAAAQAVGNVNLSIDLTNGILILYYYSNLTVQVDLASLVGTPAGCVLDAAGHLDCETAAAQTVAAAYSGGPPATAMTADFNFLPAALGALNALPLTLQEVWAVRALGGATANSQVAISNTVAALVNGGSSIGLSGWLLNSPNTIGPPGATITFPDPGLVNAEVGNVIVTLDFTSATAGGVYTTAPGTEYTLTATNL